MVEFGELESLEEKILVRPQNIKPTREDFEVVGVFNPGAVLMSDGSTFFMLRVAESPREEIYGDFCVPRAVTRGYEHQDYEIVLDRFKENELRAPPRKSVIELINGTNRNKQISHFRYAKSSDGFCIDELGDEPFFYPVHPFEELGVEDARLTMFGDNLFMTYVAGSRTEGVVTGLARFDSSKFRRIYFGEDTEHAVWNDKDVALFPRVTSYPRKKYKLPAPTAFIRPYNIGGLSNPGVSVSWSSELDAWDKGRQVLRSLGAEMVGTGTPPIKVDNMWLAVFHEVHKTEEIDANERMYYRGFFAVDLKDAWKVRYRSKPVKINLPETQGGFIPGLQYCDYVTGAILRDDKLYTYGGVGDTCTAVVTYSIEDVLRYLKDTNVL